jgi:molybdopterin-guanine dinucleotide biosynthesis protein A
MPKITLDFLEKMATHCEKTIGTIPRINSEIEPLIAFYPKSALSLVTKLLKQNLNSAKHFAQSCVELKLARLIDITSDDEKKFKNWNSVSDYSHCEEH